jgi:molybdate transport system regulatory protein
VKKIPATSLKIKMLPRLRLVIGNRHVLGPGMAEILQRIEQTGSLRQAALSMKMSYMKGWLLVKKMNQAFRLPLVQVNRGGSQGGGTQLTPTGKKVLGLYRQMHENSLHAIASDFKKIRRFLA